jgi:SAM-dependent methyltransferase
MAWSLEHSYTEYPVIEEEFEETLDESLAPRGPDVLFELVARMGLRAGATAIDVGCGEGGQAIALAERFGFTVTGIDPVQRHIDVARAAAGTAAAKSSGVGSAGVGSAGVGSGGAGWGGARRPGPGSGGVGPGGAGSAGVEAVGFRVGRVEELPVVDRSVDLVWCRDVLVHVADLARAYREFRRVLKSGGRVLVYQMFGTESLEPREAAWLFATMGVVPGSADPASTDAAIAAAGLRVEHVVELSSEWGEWAQERNGKPGRKLLHAARLRREKKIFIDRYGEAAYEMMVADCYWHVYAMIGKLTRRVYVLTT